MSLLSLEPARPERICVPDNNSLQFVSSYGLVKVRQLSDLQFECSELCKIVSMFRPRGLSGKNYIFIFMDCEKNIYYTVEYDSSGMIDFGVPVPPSMKIHRISCAYEASEWLYNNEHERESDDCFFKKGRFAFFNKYDHVLFFVAHE